MFEEIERFEAVDESGNHYTVIHRQRILEKRFLDGSTGRTAGLEDYVTSSGIDLQPRPDGSFEMIQIDGILRKLD